jgi:hypothetical protein
LPKTFLAVNLSDAFTFQEKQHQNENEGLEMKPLEHGVSGGGPVHADAQQGLSEPVETTTVTADLATGGEAADTPTVTGETAADTFTATAETETAADAPTEIAAIDEPATTSDPSKPEAEAGEGGGSGGGEKLVD